MMMGKVVLGRIAGHRNPGGHLPWVSRDYADLDCRATGCLFNRHGKCATPSRAKMDEAGRCTGFTAPPAPKVAGD